MEEWPSAAVNKWISDGIFWHTKGSERTLMACNDGAHSAGWRRRDGRERGVRQGQGWWCDQCPAMGVQTLELCMLCCFLLYRSSCGARSRRVMYYMGTAMYERYKNVVKCTVSAKNWWRVTTFWRHFQPRSSQPPRWQSWEVWRRSVPWIAQAVTFSARGTKPQFCSRRSPVLPQLPTVQAEASARPRDCL